VVRGSADFHIFSVDAICNPPAPLSANFGFSLGGPAQVLNNDGTINATANVTELETDAPATYTIENGVRVGQLKIVWMRVAGASGTLSTNIHAQSIVWNAANQTCVLLWTGLQWLPIAGTAIITP